MNRDYRIVLGFFSKRERAEEALQNIGREQVGKAGLLSRTAEGRLETLSCLPALPATCLNFYRDTLLPGELLLVVKTTSDKLPNALSALGRSEPAASFIFQPPDAPIPERAELTQVREPAAPDLLRSAAAALASGKRAGPPLGKQYPDLWKKIAAQEQTLESAIFDLTQTYRLEKGASGASELLFDNQYVFRAHIADIRRNLPKNYRNKLPSLCDAVGRRPILRVYELARELVHLTDARLHRDVIIDFLDAYQSVTPLTIAELWVFPVMLRIVLIAELEQLAGRVQHAQVQHEEARFWANRLLTAARLEQADAMLHRLDSFKKDVSPHFAARLSEQLHDEESTWILVQEWLAAKASYSLAEGMQADRHHQAADQVSVANAIASLRALSQIDYLEIFEAVSPVDAVLRRDPAGIYSKSDFKTRDRSRRSVERIARNSRSSESEVAQLAVDAAAAASDSSLCREHVGYHLLDAGLPALESRAGYRPPAAERIVRTLERYAAAAYLGSIAALTLCLLLFLAGLAMDRAHMAAWIVSSLLALFPLSEVATQIVQSGVTAVFRPRMVPRMAYDDGVPAEAATLIVVPMMLTTPEAIRAEAEKLEIRYLANQDDHLYFSLLSDFCDAPDKEMPEDTSLVGIAAEAIERLNAVHGNRFLLFHRERTWSESEQRWMGWERKRGKLQELNAFLCGDLSEERPFHTLAGKLNEKIRYVITLDADTKLPVDTARRLIEAASHPLNRPELASDRRHRVRGSVIIQPRVSTPLPESMATFFTRLFTDTKGTDPYCQAVSDVYEDLFGEGIFIGKAIYDVEAMHLLLKNRFPNDSLLSHDLLEGNYVGVSLAGDIELFENFPLNYQSYSWREHRWTRGDWQIAEWALPTVPSAAGGREPNPLSLIGRWKILDNLRRSLVSSASVALLLGAWLGNAAPGIWILAASLPLLMPVFTSVLRRAAASARSELHAWREAYKEWLRMVAAVSVMPHQAWLASDAILRALYRRYFSRRHLLEWETAESTRLSSERHLSTFLVQTFFICLGTAVVLAIVIFRGGHWYSYAYLGLWLASPAVVRTLGMEDRQKSLTLSKMQRVYLRRLARETWRYFDDHVGPQTNWLPPDNSQEALRVEVAQRTSPTNIGFWLVSALAARDLAYITPDQLVQRCSATMDVLNRLERYEGHLLNWYDITSLQPLAPRYVSTVDSGNFLASLWTVSQGLQEVLAAPILPNDCLQGLSDTLAIAADCLPSGISQLRVAHNALRTFFAHATGERSIIGRLRLASAPVGHFVDALRWIPGKEGEPAYWIRRMESQLGAWTETADRYLRWVELLGAPHDNFVQPLGPAAREARRRALRERPSLLSLAEGSHPDLEDLLGMHDDAAKLSREHANWIEGMREEYGRARAAAAETVANVKSLIAKIEAFGNAVNLRFLYDPSRRLFHVGYAVGAPQFDPAHYDFLASEASLSSLVAIARGEAPIEHWLALGRPYTSAPGALLSWSGTMFEYLMPMLFTRSFRNSLLDYAHRQAVACQIEYGRERGVPWGISESAFSALDSRQTYQYRAFGVPGLSLRQTDIEDDLVVSPYSTMLAMPVNFESAMDNFARLEQAGLRGPMGFYEAIDYTRQRNRGGTAGVVIYSYMAHHQGMSLMALDNILHGGILQRRFHADPRVKAVEPLLYERIPSVRSLLESTPEQAWHHQALGETESAGRTMTQDTPIPRAHLLGHESYSLMITNSGGGYSRWRDCDVTRWRADTTRDPWGSFCHIRDLRSNSGWSATFHPDAIEDKSYAATFNADRAEFSSRHAGIDSLLEVTVASENDAEIRRLTLVNRSLRTRSLEASSFMELAMAPHNADRAHPAFSKMFVETEAVPELKALIAHRRPRSPGEKTVWAGHVALGGWDGQPFRYDTDRAAFIGRGRSVRNAAGWEAPAANTAGTVLDPIFCIRRKALIDVRDSVRLHFVTVAGESREAVIRLLEKYRSPETCDRAFELAWTHAQLEFRYLGIDADTAHRFQELASHLLYPNARLRATEERLSRKHRGLSSLWAHGISGDLPIALVNVADLRGISIVREALQAHTFWRLRGYRVDLVIVNQEEDGYDQPLNARLLSLIQAHSMHTGVDVPGGVFLRKWRLFSREDLDALFAAASISLGATHGLVIQDFGRPLEISAFRQRLPALRIASPEPSPELPYLELNYFNGRGGFSLDDREYCIYLRPADVTPLPWINVLANPSFGALVSESGSGSAWNCNSQSNRLTPWHNDPVSDPPSDVIYIRDEETGIYWTPTALPIRDKTAYRVRHGRGYSLFEHNSNGIEQVLLKLVPMDGKNGEPVCVQRLRLFNRSGRKRRLSVTFYAEWVLGASREESQSHIVSQWDGESGALTARNGFHPDFSNSLAFSAMMPKAASYSGDRAAFLGRNGAPDQPVGMGFIHLSGRAGPALDPCSALRTFVEIESGQEKEITMLLGQAESLIQVRVIVERYRAENAVENALVATRQWWDGLLGAIHVKTPLRSVDLLLNGWLLYQTLACRVWARSAFYQSSGAFGFRDQLQDVLALLYSAPQLARQHIFRAAARQFPEGDVQHWWHEPGDAGIRTRCSDDLLWLPYAVAQYLEVTADASILDEAVPFVEGPLLKEQEQEAFFVPSVSREKSTVYEHCKRAIERGCTSGRHGLPLIGSCDWNDGLNLVGVEGRGESVWLAFFLIDVLNRFAPVAEARGEASLAREWKDRATQYETAASVSAWDGDWYLRAFFDDGTPLGSHESSEARIDVLPQAWAVIAGTRDRSRNLKAMESLEKYLVRDREKLVLLLNPPFDHSTPYPGYIQGYPPGLRENGGQYTHGALWAAMSFVRLGDGARAVRLLQLMNPIEHALSPQDADRYQAEPYVASGDVYSNESHMGRAGWTWYTGSAAWMYRIWLEEVLGFQLRGETLSIRPVLPPDWDGYELTYRRGNTAYDIQVKAGSSPAAAAMQVECDGVPMSGSSFAVKDDGLHHLVKVTVSSSERPQEAEAVVTKSAAEYNGERMSERDIPDLHASDATVIEDNDSYSTVAGAPPDDQPGQK